MVKWEIQVLRNEARAPSDKKVKAFERSWSRERLDYAKAVQILPLERLN